MRGQKGSSSSFRYTEQKTQMHTGYFLAKNSRFSREMKPHPTHHFCQTTLPTLKHSLSLTLSHFFPLAGNLLCPSPPHKPFIRNTNDREVLKDPRGLEAVFLRQYFEERTTWKGKLGGRKDDSNEDFVKATIVFGKICQSLWY